MRWVECPLLDDGGATLHPPSCSDDEDEDTVVDLLNRREGHCAAVLCEADTTDAGASWVVVCGGYTKGIVAAAPLVAPVALLPALQWRELPVVAEFECDGASLTTVDAEETSGVPSAPTVCHSGAASVAYLFGGFDSEVELRNTLYAVTLTGEKSGGNEPSRIPSLVSVTALATTGTVPLPRARHGAGGSRGRLYIFGGETATQEQTSELYVCDVRSGVWRLVETAASCPAPRLLSLSLVFVTPTTFVFYGGSHFVQGAVQSFRDAWSFDVDSEVWTQVAADAEDSGLPRSNGHVGGAVLLPRTATETGCSSGSNAPLPFPCAVFVGGKNISEGDDRMKLIRFCPATRAFEIRVEDALPAVNTASVPHWRYTPALVATEKGLLLLAGQCRHAQVPSSFLLRFE